MSKMSDLSLKEYKTPEGFVFINVDVYKNIIEYQDALIVDRDYLTEKLYAKDADIGSLSDMLSDANNEIERLWKLCVDSGIDPGKPEIPF